MQKLAKLKLPHAHNRTVVFHFFPSLNKGVWGRELVCAYLCVCMQAYLKTQEKLDCVDLSGPQAYIRCKTNTKNQYSRFFKLQFKTISPPPLPECLRTRDWSFVLLNIPQCTTAPSKLTAAPSPDFNEPPDQTEPSRPSQSQLLGGM